MTQQSESYNNNSQKAPLVERIDKGLDETEIKAIEGMFDFSFPEDLVAFLKAGIPIGKGFPDWHGCAIDDEEAITTVKSLMDWPIESMAVGLENDDIPPLLDQPGTDSSNALCLLCDLMRDALI
eukprot:gnl/Chilomastix_caulleri/2637.p1 GENE.gnl/Chilomastix_caulleri/2637~~gnl/Chilomastix_caulleri/2637.p1  ORF type:complete len:124 (+),score=22.38 gnl/Chilomastix_caulleri/2637:38-409(+)